MVVRLQLVPDPAESDCDSEPARAIRVVLADNHAAMRRSLRRLLDGEQDLEVIAEASDLSTVNGDLADVLVLDLGMHNGSSLEAIRRLRREVTAPEIVALTMKKSSAFAQRAMDAGAVGFVLKDQADRELSDAIRSAACGEEYISPSVAAGVDSLRRTRGGNGLTTRETRVLRLIALGHTSAEIARNLHLSAGAVQTHRARIHRKLGLATRADLVSYALGRSLIGA